MFSFEVILINLKNISDVFEYIHESSEKPNYLQYLRVVNTFWLIEFQELNFFENIFFCYFYIHYDASKRWSQVFHQIFGYSKRKFTQARNYVDLKSMKLTLKFIWFLFGWLQFNDRSFMSFGIIIYA